MFKNNFLEIKNILSFIKIVEIFENKNNYLLRNKFMYIIVIENESHYQVKNLIKI